MYYVYDAYWEDLFKRVPPDKEVSVPQKKVLFSPTVSDKKIEDKINLCPECFTPILEEGDECSNCSS